MTEPLVRPFAGLRPAPGRASDVAAPPYDVVSVAEARSLAVGRPWSFLHVSRAEIDLPAGTDPHDEAVYDRAAENLRRMIGEGVLIRDEQPCYYVYRLRMGNHVQTGIVGAASVVAYDSNRIRRHELTRPDKEDDRVRQIDVLNAQTGPVMATHRRDQRIADVIAKATTDEPDSHVIADDGIEHSVWIINGADEISALNETFDAMDAIYIADGHHRSASASRVAAARRAHNPEATGDEVYEFFLMVTFPDDEVKIFDYNRVVRDLNGLSGQEFMSRVGEAFVISPVDKPAKPSAARQFGMYLGGQWYLLELREAVSAEDPVAALDISVLTDLLLTPVLGIGDPRLDKRIEFIGGIRGMAELERRVDSGEMAVAFALFATSLGDLMAVADAGQVMPPKSTWFEPKLADGLVSLVLD